MKSVTIRNKKSGEILIKIIQRKNGVYETILKENYHKFLDIEIRGDRNCKVDLYDWQLIKPKGEK